MTAAQRTTPFLLIVAALATGCFRTDVLGEDLMNGASGMGAGAGAGTGGTMAGEGGASGMAGSAGEAGDSSTDEMVPDDTMTNPMGMDPEPCEPSLLATQVDVSVDSTCAVTDEGALYCWGRDNVTDESVTAPTQVTGIMGEVQSIALGGYFGCALTVHGTVWCWGSNDQGQLGNGTLDHSADPTPIPNLMDVEQIAAGLSHACALRSGGEVWCWGNNDSGQLGAGDAVVTEPIATWTSGNLAVQVTAGYQHTCVRDHNDRVSCAGGNPYGQLGNGTNQSSDQFVSLDIVAKDVSAGFDHTCAVDDQGDVWCWGSNGSGELGDGTTGGPIGMGMPSGRTSPVRVTDLHGMSKVHATLSHTCAVSQMGIVHCWGSNQFSALGYDGDAFGDFKLAPVPATLIDGSISSMAAGGSHSCVIMGTGELNCWGSNQFGQVGDGTLTDRYEPEPVGDFACD